MIRTPLKILITLTLVFSIMIPTAVFADESDEDNREAVEEIDAALLNKNVILEEDIVAKGEDQDAVFVGADNGHTAEVTTQNVSAEDGFGIVVHADNGSTAEVTVNGDATGKGEDTTGPYAQGVLVESDTDSKATVTVTGDVSGSQTAIGAGAHSGGETTVTVTGDVSGKDGYGVVAVILDESPGSKSAVTINVGGDAKGPGGIAVRNGIDETVSEIMWGERQNSYGGVAKVTVEGNAIASELTGIEATTFNGGVSDIFVAGDVKAEKIGIYAVADKSSSNNIVVAGTVSGKDAGVTISKNNSLTVWKIETKGDAPLVGTYDTDTHHFVENKEAEKTIQYIIKVEQPKGATLRATDDRGKNLATVTAANGSTFEYAHTGDKVLLKIDIDDDYKLDAVYGDKGQQYKLVKDESGNYYVEVPAGGGVYFSAVLTKKDKDKDKEEEKNKDTKTESNTWSVMSTESQNAITSITTAPTGGTANIAITTGTIDASVVRMILARRDINVSIACFVNGKLCVITIPAGADVSGLIAANGTIDVAKLAEKFGSVEVR